MKRGTPEHYKTMRLAAELECSRPEAMGLLEGLWHFTARSCPQGNIGRCTNREIALGCYSDRDGDEIVRAFVAAGWLDESDEHRLVVHDWHDHAEEAVKKLLERRGVPFLSLSGKRRDMSRKRRDMSSAKGETCRAPARGKGKGLGKGKGSVSEGECRGETIPLDLEAEFETRWKRYVRRDGKQAALKAWLALDPDAELLEKIDAALEWQCKLPGWLKEGGQFAPHFSTYLNQARWQDEPPLESMADPSQPSPLEVIRRMRDAHVGTA